MLALFVALTVMHGAPPGLPIPAAPADKVKVVTSLSSTQRSPANRGRTGAT